MLPWDVQVQKNVWQGHPWSTESFVAWWILHYFHLCTYLIPPGV